MIGGAPSVEEAIRAIYGDDTGIERRRPVGGGCINSTFLLELTNSSSLFLKENSVRFEHMFQAEALGLEALRKGGGPRVPAPLAWGENANRQFILIEYIDQGARAGDFWERFGRELAELHRSNTSDRCGFDADNFIGSNPQRNGWTGGWIEFFAEKRLRFQLELAQTRGAGDRGRLCSGVERLIDRLPELLIEPGRPSLLHGDLWGGNYMIGQFGEPVLIDPAVYFGHREADLAMTELFGGFDPRFYAAYREAFPLEPGYPERRDLYNLYHLLNHFNLFGSSYEGSVRSIVSRYVR